MLHEIFDRISRQHIDKLLETEELRTFYNAIHIANYLVDSKGEEFFPHTRAEQLTITVLLAFRSIRNKKLYSNASITNDDIQKAFAEIDRYWAKFLSRSYCYEKEKDFCDPIGLFYEDLTAIIFKNMLRVLGDLNELDIAHSRKWPNEDELKDSIIKILEHPYLLDHLPVDILATLDKEYYTLKYEEFKEKKAMVSWFQIINSLTEDQLEDNKAIKLFVHEALDKAQLSQETKSTIKEHLKLTFKSLKNHQPTPHTTITNNFNAPISNFAQEQHIDNLTTK